MTDIEYVTVLATDNVGEFVGTDGEEYDVRKGETASLPEENAEVLIRDGRAEHLSGPPEPIMSHGDDLPQLAAPTDDGTEIDRVDLNSLVCKRCGTEMQTDVSNGEIQTPYECAECERQGPFEHTCGLSVEQLQVALLASNLWYLPSGVTDEGYTTLWDDVKEYLYDHWDAGTGDNADAVYAGLTAYALSTWVRQNLPFVPHLMLMGKTTGGKTRLLNTLSRVSYRAIVSASATPASMFRLIENYNVSYYISEYHGLHSDTQNDMDNIVRAGQKRGEKVTRAEPTSDGYEPNSFDPFTHVAIATQYEPDDDIVNRCIQVQSSTAGREMPATLDDERARKLRNRLLYARFRLIDSEEWDAAEQSAYEYLANRSITGRTREKLLGLLAIGYLWDRVDALSPFVDMVVEQDREAAADSEDARVVEAIRDLAFEEIGETTVLGDNDPFGAVEIPYQDVADYYEEQTGIEKTASWVGHARKRLGLDKERKRDGTVISDPNLGPKLQKLCDELNLEWERSDVHDAVEALSEDTQANGTCSDCGRDRYLTHRHVEEGHYLCGDCAEEIRQAET